MHVHRAIGIVRTGSHTDLEVVDDVHVCRLWSGNSSVPASTLQMKVTILRQTAQIATKQNDVRFQDLPVL
jgi:hypothetical protein